MRTHQHLQDPPLTGPAAAAAPYYPLVTSVTYNGDGTVAALVEDGVTTSYTYNTDGTVHTDTRGAITRTYSYTAGNLTGIS